MFQLLRFLMILAFLPGLALAQDEEYPPLSVKMEATQVAPHSYYIQGLSGAASAENEGFMSNAGFVVTPAGVVVIDSLGSPSLGQAMIKLIRGITSLPIKYVIVTHYHADHIYGLQAFKEAGAEIWAHENGKAYLVGDVLEKRLAQRREELFPWINEKTRVLPADKWLKGDTELTLGGMHFLIRHVGPAHTDEDLAIYVPEDKVLYSGDLVFKGRVPYVGDANSKAWLASLDKLLEFHPAVMVPGHGAVSHDAAHDLTFTRDYLAYLRDKMGQAVENFVPFEEAYSQTDWSRYNHLPAFDAANRRNAYNTYLLMEKEALGK